LENDIIEFGNLVEALALEIHIIDFDLVVEKILNIEGMIKPIKDRIEISLKDEELLFSFKLGNFEALEKHILKLQIFSVFWKNAKMLFEHKKHIIYEFTIEFDFLSYINILVNIDKTIEANREKALKDNIDIILKHSRLVRDDIIRLKEFLVAVNGIKTMNPLDEAMMNKIILLLESRKLDTSLRQILSYCLRLKKIKIDLHRTY
jgi:hypothetical protein